MMSLIGSETPRLFTLPARPLTPETTRGFEFIDFTENIVGITLMPWQKWLAIHGLELAEDGSFRFRTLLVLVARQNGKSSFLQLLALWRMFVDGAELVLGSAQNLALAEELWEGSLSMVEGVPELAAELANVSRVNGDKNFRLVSGARYKTTAASRRAARGLSSDLVLLDELREHTDWQAWGAISKTTLARPSPMIVGASNAGDYRSVVLESFRSKALAAVSEPTSSLGIFEWSAPEGCALDDPRAWAAANPALGHRITEVALRSALEVDPEPVFRTEVLCQSVAEIAAAIDPLIWTSLADGLAEQGAQPVFALDVAHDQSTATVAVAWKRPDGAAQVMLAHHQAGVEGIGQRIGELAGKWGGRFIVEQAGTAAWLLSDLEARGVTVEKVQRAFWVQSCAALDAAITARQVRHGNQPELNDAVDRAQWATSGETGQRTLSRHDPKMSPLVAATLALHGLTALPERKRPGRFVSVNYAY